MNICIAGSETACDPERMEKSVNELSKIEPRNIGAETMDREDMVTYPTEAFLSKEYLQAEKKLLWPKIWQMVERETDLPNPGDWLTYDVADESIIVLRKDDGSLEAPTVESRYREASDSFVQINGFELNRDTATGNLLVSQPIDLFRTADNTKIASVEEVDLTSMRSFNNYTIVGDGTLNVSSLRLRASDKRAHRALRDLGLAIGDYTPNAPFTVDMSTLPLVDYDTTFDTVDPATVRNLARLTVLSKILAGLTKGQSVSLTDAQVAALKGVYVSASLNFSPPTTNEYADLQVALATGKVDTRLSYKILVGIPELTSVTKLASGNAYLQRRFTATQGATKVDKPTLDMVTTTGVTFAIKKLTAATKLDTVDEIAYPIYEGFLGLGDQTEVQNVLKLAGCTNPATFLAEVRSGNRERIVETVKEGQALVDAAIEGIYAKVRPLAFYVGASGIVPDTLGAVAMTGEDFATKYPTAKLAKDEKEEGTFFVLPNGTVLTVYVKGEYFSTAAATTPQN